MGLKLQRKVLRSTIRPRYRFLATVLALYADDNTGENIYPSVATLARDLGVGRDSIMRQLRVMRQEGLLEVVRKGGGRHRTTHYRFVAEQLERGNSSSCATVSHVDKDVPGATVSGETVAFGTVETVAFRPRNGSVEATQEPSKDKTKELENHQEPKPYLRYRDSAESRDLPAGSASSRAMTPKSHSAERPHRSQEPYEHDDPRFDIDVFKQIFFPDDAASMPPKAVGKSTTRRPQ